MKDKREALQIIADINERLDRVEELLMWTITSEQRFKRGQRVQFNERADRSGVSSRTKRGVRKGRVTHLNGFSVLVLMDGYKHAKSFHHGFFDPVTRSGK